LAILLNSLSGINLQGLFLVYECREELPNEFKLDPNRLDLNRQDQEGEAMTTKPQSKLFAGLLLISLIAACSPAPSSAPPAAEATSAPADDATVDATDEATVEATPAATEATESPATEATDDSAASDSTLPTGLRTYVIVPEESTASYIADEEFFGLALGKYGIPEGLVDTVGTTNAIEGQFQLNWDDLNAPLGENTFTVDLSTLKSNQSLRDEWIRDNEAGPQFGTHPDATFVAESLEGAPDSYTPGEEVSFQMVGQMTVREVTKPATFDVTAKLEDGTITGTATTALKLTDFEITPPDFANTLTVADDFQVEVKFTAREQ
jgi:polyisoprenoid-binding protein YceI